MTLAFLALLSCADDEMPVEPIPLREQAGRELASLYARYDGGPCSARTGDDWKACVAGGCRDGRVRDMDLYFSRDADAHLYALCSMHYTAGNTLTDIGCGGQVCRRLAERNGALTWLVTRFESPLPDTFASSPAQLFDVPKTNIWLASSEVRHRGRYTADLERGLDAYVTPDFAYYGVYLSLSAIAFRRAGAEDCRNGVYWHHILRVPSKASYVRERLAALGDDAPDCLKRARARIERQYWRELGLAQPPE